MKVFGIVVAFIGLVLLVGQHPDAYAQSSMDSSYQERLTRYLNQMKKNYTFRGRSVNDPCYRASGQPAFNNINIYENWGRCRAEIRYCKSLGSDGYKNSLTGAYKQCVKEFWKYVEREDWINAHDVRFRRNAGAFDRYNSAGSNPSKPTPPPQPIIQPPLPINPPVTSKSTKSSGLESIDGSDIEMLEIEEDKPEPENSGKSCLCYAGDFENLGICHTSDPNSPNYNKRNAWGELISTYPTGDYPWTSACKHPVGGRVNLQEWYDNYNNQ